jgi:CheY-like chemotaxis protein
VDNERVDRELLAHLLEPLGFEVGQAESGYDCLKLVPHFRPHLIFMDLAMPGIDGWETIRRLRAGGLDEVPVAIISANAFDKGLEHDVGIGAEDFILKPIRVEELLDWIGRSLQLEWVWADAPDVAACAPAAEVARLVLPPAAELRALDELIELGFLRGILARLAEIERMDPVHAEFVRVQRELARQFQFDAMREILCRKDLPES